MATWEERMGRAAFEAYAQRLKELSDFSVDLGSWSELHPNVQTGWAAAARAVANKLSVENTKR